MVPMIHPTAEISGDAVIGEGVSIWRDVHVREGASIGSQSIIGGGAYIGPGVVIGARCKVQNYALVYEPATVGEGVFIGPAVVLTNDRRPRAVNPDGSLKSASDWDLVGVTIGTGASIGAGAVCVAPVTIGRWAMVAAGSVVTRDVPDFALVAGNPARRAGWVGPAGERLATAEDGTLICPRTGSRFRLAANDLLVEDA